MEYINYGIVVILIFIQMTSLWRDIKELGLYETLLAIPLCSKCSSFILTLILTGDIFLAAKIGLSLYLYEKIWDRL